jgi:hypothetical protein
MKHLRVTIVNDEGADKGAVRVQVKDAKGNVTLDEVIPEAGEDEIRFTEKGSILITGA